MLLLSLLRSTTAMAEPITTTLSLFIVHEAYQLRAQGHVIARMLGNVAFDGVCGAVPLVGDAFDVLWRANRRNVRLLRECRAVGRRIAMSIVSLLLNLLWIVFGGLWMALAWVIAAVVMAITIVGLPWARAAFSIAAYTLLPFGYKAVPRDELFWAGAARRISPAGPRCAQRQRARLRDARCSPRPRPLLRTTMPATPPLVALLPGALVKHQANVRLLAAQLILDTPSQHRET
jgi:inner membrane component-like transport protein/uncharacterized protein DUF4112